MKNKFLVVALIVVILMAGVVMVSCNLNCTGDGKCYADETDVAGSIASWCFSMAEEDEAAALECIGDYNGGAKVKCGCK
ncbi:MAG: hypothetical protein FWB95_03775 [Treponema sp.]|nr:hypothetical protein [Treponema sp.]